MTTVFEASIWNFQELIRASVPTKHTSRNFDFGDLRSVQFWDLTNIRQWGNVHMPFFSESTGGNELFISGYSYIRPSGWPACSFDPCTEWYAIWPTWLDTWPHATLTWGQILTLTFKVKVYIFRRVLTSRIRCCQNYFSSFLSSKTICKKTLLQKALFWPLLTSLA